MGIKCKIRRDKNGEVMKAIAPNGEPSSLYEEAKALFDDDTALHIWALPYTPKFISYYGNWRNPDPADMFNLDVNGEPLLYDVLKYIERETSPVGDLSAEEVSDIRNTIMSLGLSGFDEFAARIKDSFSLNGKTYVDEKTLRDSGLFTPFEIDRIVSDSGLMDEVANTIRKVVDLYDKGYDSGKLDFYFGNSHPSFIVYSSGYNALGKRNIYNPAEIDAELRRTVGGLKTYADMDAAIGSSSYPELIDMYENVPGFREKVFEEYSPMERAAVLDIGEGGATWMNEDMEKAVMFASYDQAAAGRVRAAVRDILSIPDSEWKNEWKNTNKKLKYLERDAAKMGIDLAGLSGRFRNKQELADFLTNLVFFLPDIQSGNMQNLRALGYEIGNFFGRPDTDVVNVRKDLGTPVYKINSEKDSRRLYEEDGYLKVDNGVYIEAHNDVPLDEIYGEMAEAIREDPSSLPALTRVLPASVLASDDIAGGIRRMVRYMSDYYNSEEMILGRILAGSSPLTFHEAASTDRGVLSYYSTREEAEKAEYALYKSYLSHKLRNDDEWRNVYQYMKFQPGGKIEMTTDHPAAVKSIALNATERTKDLLRAVWGSYNNEYFDELFYADDTIPTFSNFDSEAKYNLRNPEQVKEASVANEVEGGTEVPGEYGDFIRIGDRVLSKIAESGRGGIYSGISFDGAENIRKFAQELHDIENTNPIPNRNSLINDSSGISKQDKDKLTGLEC